MFALQFKVSCSGNTVPCVTGGHNQVYNSFKFWHLLRFDELHYPQLALFNNVESKGSITDKKVCVKITTAAQLSEMLAFAC